MTESENAARLAGRGTVAGRALAAGLLAVAVLTFALAAVRYLPSPLRFDESEFPPQARGILVHGVPKLLYDEDQRIFLHAYYGYDAHYGLWHPPLFLYSLALSIAAFGDGDAAVRLVPFAWGLLAILLAWRIVRPELPADPLMQAVPLAVVFLCPLVLGGIFYVDIDNSSLAASLFALASVYLRTDTAGPWTRRLAVSLMLAVALWSKLTTPLLMLAAIALHMWLRHGFGRAFVDAAVIALVGAGVFAASYMLYCTVLGYPAQFMFDISYVGKRGMYTSAHSMTAILHSLRWHLVWFSPALACAALWAAWQRLARYVRTRTIDETDVLWVFAGITFAEYIVGGAMMGKYTVPAAMALCLLIGREVAGAAMTLSVRRVAPALAVMMLLAILHLTVLPPLTLRPPTGFAPPVAETLVAGARDPRNLDLLIAIAAGLIGAAVMSRGWRSSSAGGAITVGLLLWSLAANPAAHARVLLAAGDRAPLRVFEESGFRATIDWLNAHAAPSSVIVCSKDIGLRLAVRHYALDEVTEAGTATIAQVLARPNVEFLVDSDAYPQLLRRDVLAASGFVPVHRSGTFAIYGRVTSTPIGQVTPVPPTPQ